MRKLVLLLTIAMVSILAYAHWRTIRYDAIIRTSCDRYHLDFHLVKSVVWEESGFDSQARGKSGELGLMQVMPYVGREFWERQKKGTTYDPGLLLDPEHNLDVGCWYLRESLDMYRGMADPLPYALARYNAGQRRVTRWISQCDQQNDSSSFLKQIDFPTTRVYVQRVIERSKRQAEIYLW